MPKLTKRTVDALRSDPSRRIFVADEDLAGFGMRITPNGTKSYIVEYRPGAGGRNAPRRRITIGRHGSPWTPETARAEARRLLSLVAGGADPARDRAEARKEADADRTFAVVAQRFLDRHGRTLRSSTVRDYRGIINGKLVPAWGDRPVDRITRREVARLVDRVADTAPIMARLTFSVVRVFFGWCIENDYLDANPCDGMKGPAVAKARDRILDEREICLLWRATEAGGRFDTAVRLLLLTGARRDQVGAATWAEVDSLRAVWTLAAGRCKNGAAHEIDLAPAALTELDRITTRQRLEMTPEDGPPPTDAELAAFRRSVAPYLSGGTPLAGWSKAKRQLDVRMAKLAAADGFDPPAPWRIHDLRRTAASGMAALGFGPQVVERVLNHLSGVRGGLTGVYQRHEYRDQRRAASLGWAAHVTRVVAGSMDESNVVALQRGDGVA